MSVETGRESSLSELFWRPRRGYQRGATRGYDSGPDCAVCGYKRVNVRHEQDPDTSPEGPSYYADMLQELHPFVPVGPR